MGDFGFVKTSAACLVYPFAKTNGEWHNGGLYFSPIGLEIDLGGTADHNDPGILVPLCIGYQGKRILLEFDIHTVPGYTIVRNMVFSPGIKLGVSF